MFKTKLITEYSEKQEPKTRTLPFIAEWVNPERGNSGRLVVLFSHEETAGTVLYDNSLYANTTGKYERGLHSFKNEEYWKPFEGAIYFNSGWKMFNV